MTRKRRAVGAGIVLAAAVIADAPMVPLALGSGAGTLVTVRYAGATPREKSALGKLVIAHDGMADEVTLSAGALATSIAVNPDTIDFGPICAGSRRPSR